MDFLLRKTARLCLWLVFSLLLSAVPADLIEVLLGDSVTFPATRNCSKENAELIHRSCDNSNRTVARYQDGAWSPGPGYEDRVDEGDTVTLRNTNIMDSGLYELTCYETPTELDVVHFPVVQAAEGQMIMLQCHYLTTNKKVESAWWEKDGKRVFGTNFPPGEIKPEAGFKGRVSLPDKVLERGDFSVIVQRVRPEDGGDYRCYVQVGGQKEMGTPAATRLTVNELSATGCTGYQVATGVLAVLCVALGFILQKHLNPTCCKENKDPTAKTSASKDGDSGSHRDCHLGASVGWWFNYRLLICASSGATGENPVPDNQTGLLRDSPEDE